MTSKKQSPQPVLRTILEKIDKIDSEVVAQRAILVGHGTALEGLTVKVDSQTLLIEDMRSQNRATIEAVEASRQALEQRIDRVDQDSRARDAVLELAIRELKVNVQQNSIDIRDLTGRVEALARIDERVTAIERRLS
jgi:cell division protein FtsB